MLSLFHSIVLLALLAFGHSKIIRVSFDHPPVRALWTEMMSRCSIDRRCQSNYLGRFLEVAALPSLQKHLQNREPYKDFIKKPYVSATSDYVNRIRYLRNPPPFASSVLANNIHTNVRDGEYAVYRNLEVILHLRDNFDNRTINYRNQLEIDGFFTTKGFASQTELIKGIISAKKNPFKLSSSFTKDLRKLKCVSNPFLAAPVGSKRFMDAVRVCFYKPFEASILSKQSDSGSDDYYFDDETVLEKDFFARLIGLQVQITQLNGTVETLGIEEFQQRFRVEYEIDPSDVDLTLPERSGALVSTSLEDFDIRSSKDFVDNDAIKVRVEKVGFTCTPSTHNALARFEKTTATVFMLNIDPDRLVEMANAEGCAGGVGGSAKRRMGEDGVWTEVEERLCLNDPIVVPLVEGGSKKKNGAQTAADFITNEEPLPQSPSPASPRKKFATSMPFYKLYRKYQRENGEWKDHQQSKEGGGKKKHQNNKKNNNRGLRDLL